MHFENKLNFGRSQINHIVMMAFCEYLCYSPLIFFMEKACAANFRYTIAPT